MSRVILYLLCALVSARLSLAFYTDCGNERSLGKIINVVISNCNEKPLCILKKNTNVTIEISFQAKSNISEVYAIVHGKINYLPPIIWPIDGPNACSNPTSGIKCPLVAGNNYIYKHTLFVKRDYPNINVEINWKLQQNKEDIITCIEIPSKITN